MNRSQVISQTAERLGKPVETVEAVVSAFFELCAEALAQGEPVNIRRFGKFEPRLRRAMVKPNPKTGDPMVIPERLSAAFLPSELLKAALNADTTEV